MKRLWEIKEVIKNYAYQLIGKPRPLIAFYAKPDERGGFFMGYECSTVVLGTRPVDHEMRSHLIAQVKKCLSMLEQVQEARVPDESNT